MRIIGLMGRAQSGKDTVARELVANHAYVRVAFADPLREMALALDPLIAGGTRLSHVVDARGWEDAKRTHPEVRRVLQRLGLEAVRDILGDNTWVDLGIRRIVDALDRGTPVVVTDVRFDNEACALAAMGATLVWVERPGASPGDHRSEHELTSDDAHEVLHNNGSVDDLHTQVRMLFTR